MVIGNTMNMTLKVITNPASDCEAFQYSASCLQTTEIEPGDVMSFVSAYGNTDKKSVKMQMIYDIC